MDRFTFIPSAMVMVRDDYIVQPEDSDGDGQSDEVSIVSQGLATGYNVY